MQSYGRIAAVLALGLNTVGCDKYLTGPGISENPNDPVDVATRQLFVAMEANVFAWQESQMARQAAMFTQQLAGTNNQQQQWGSQYLLTENDINNQFGNIYIGGGLVDQRKIEDAAEAAGDAQWAGITKIFEALHFGSATSIFGDLPYRDAVGSSKAPTLDPQQQIYDDLQALLDEAITDLAGAGPGPGNADLVFGGDVTRWTKAAYTLKARYHMHTAERLGAAAYTAAIAAANQGISEAPTTVAMAIHGQAPGNLRAFHGSTVDDGNLWGQFLGARQDMNMGERFRQILVARSDPRLAEFFDPAPGQTQYFAANQFGAQVGGPPAVVDVPTRRAFPFRQPLVTWEENQLILAEAKFQTGDPTAINHVNNVRLALGLTALAPPITLAQIMEEKYIAMFQNIEAWNDYKRTCLPVLQPGGLPPAAAIPGRLPYSVNERQNNPNIPLPTDQPARNWNDPNAC